jgi:chorismate mutase
MTKSIDSKNDKKAKIRKKIDALDKTIITALERRFLLVAALSPLKKKLTDKKREEEILSKIDSALIQDIYRAIFKNSKKWQQQNFSQKNQ